MWGGSGSGSEVIRALRGRPPRRRGMIASQHAGQSPERVRDDSKARRRRRGDRVERFVIILRPRRHRQGAVGTEGVTERLDQADWSSLDRPYGAEGRVHEQHPAVLDSERAELIAYLGSAQFRHARLHFPRNSPIGASDSMWSQKILNVAMIGTARNAPGTPQIPPEDQPDEEGHRVEPQPCRDIGATKLPWMKLIARKTPGTISARPVSSNARARPAPRSTMWPPRRRRA